VPRTGKTDTVQTLNKVVRDQNADDMALNTLANCAENKEHIRLQTFTNTYTRLQTFTTRLIRRPALTFVPSFGGGSFQWQLQ
jgi:hypothetical protein